MIAVAHLAGAADTLRISLHVLAATVWIGGQIVLAGLLPTVRTLGDDAPAKIARAFARLSWPAFLLLIITGVWNVAALHNGQGAASTWQEVLGAKYVFVLLAGALVFAHTKVATAKARGLTAGLGLLASLGAMVLGILLAG